MDERVWVCAQIAELLIVCCTQVIGEIRKATTELTGFNDDRCLHNNNPTTHEATKWSMTACSKRTQVPSTDPYAFQPTIAVGNEKERKSYQKGFWSQDFMQKDENNTQSAQTDSFV